MLKIVGIGGSLRPNSQTYQVLKIALEKVNELGGESELIDLRALLLPFCDGGDDYSDYPDVAKLREKVQSAKALIIATPEYHGSISGVLKNVFDLLGSEHVEGKTFLLIAVLGGDPSTNALNVLRTICRHFHAWAIPDQLIIPNASQSLDAEGKLTDSDLEKRLYKCVKSLLDSTSKLNG